MTMNTQTQACAPLNPQSDARQTPIATPERFFTRKDWHLTLSALAAAALLGATDAGAVVYTADFNGDGFEDVVSADPRATVNGKNTAGRIAVIETDQFGLRPGLRVEQWHAGMLDAFGRVEAGGYFGQAVAIGDFNGDGYDDMAVGSPYEDVPNYPNTGAVRVIYGGAEGLNGGTRQRLYDSVVGRFHHFGKALVAADFDDDGYDDLAVGSPGRQRGTTPNVDFDDGIGGVAVYFGDPAGLGDRLVLDRTQFAVSGQAQSGAWFGEALAAGDYNGDGYPDLMVGAPRDDVRHNRVLRSDAGSLTLLFGGPRVYDGDNPFSGSRFVRDISEADNSYDQFGSVLTAGDFNGDGYADFAVGHPEEDVGSRRNAGEVTVLSGNSQSIIWRRSIWSQNSGGVPGTSERDDRFGYALTAADFDADGYDELAIGIPYEDFERVWSDKNNGGAVLVLRGSSAGLFVDADSDWHQDVAGVAGGIESQDRFGYALSSGDYDNDGIADLLIGVGGERISGYSGSGVLQLLPGSIGGLQPVGGVEQMFFGGNLLGGHGLNYGQVLP